MPEISRVALFGKLDPLAYQAIESAALFCKMRGNPYVEIAHWIHQMLELPDSDLHRILRHFQVDPSRLARDLLESLGRLPKGATSISDLSVQIEDAVERGWVYASLMFGVAKIRTGHLIVGMLKAPSLRNVLPTISKEFTKIKVEALSDGFDAITNGSPEVAMAGELAGAGAGGAPGGEGAAAPAVMGKQEALARYSVDLTERARKGELDPIVGRDDEIRQIIHILLRRRQNNPILTGEAGVGKTAVVEGFALRIVKGDVPPSLRDVTLRALDIGLAAGGREHERRVRESAAPSHRGGALVAQAHHPVHRRGAYADWRGGRRRNWRRGQSPQACAWLAATCAPSRPRRGPNTRSTSRATPPSLVVSRSSRSMNLREDKAITMMRAVAPMLEKHHRVQVLDEAVESAVKLSKRYIPARQLPDKAISLLDTACARVGVSQHASPADVEDSQKHLEALKTELEMIRRDAEIGIESKDREQKTLAAIEAEEKKLATLDRALGQRGQAREEGPRDPREAALQGHRGR